MLKRISGLIGFVILSFTVATYAQLAVGDWQIYTSTGTPVKVIDTPQRVYYVSGRSLFGFDKDPEEMESYSKNNILNDIDIANIYYNYDKKYLVIVYANSNVDILHDNGKVFNIPDIKNAILTTAKGINDVKFYGDRIYLATDFGIVVLNDKKNEVSESYNYGKKISLIGACDKYWFFVADDGLYYINSDAIKYDIAKWVLLDDIPGTTIYALMPFNDKYLFYSKGGNLHFLVDGFGLRVERAAEDVGEADDVVNLVRIVGTAGRHQYIRACGHGVLVRYFRSRVGKGEHNGMVGHAAHHILCQYIAFGQAEEYVGAFDGFGKGMHVAAVGCKVTLLFGQVLAVAGDDAFAVQHQDVFTARAERLV